MGGMLCALTLDQGFGHTVPCGDALRTARTRIQLNLFVKVHFWFYTKEDSCQYKRVSISSQGVMSSNKGRNLLKPR